MKSVMAFISKNRILFPVIFVVLSVAISGCNQENRKLRLPDDPLFGSQIALNSGLSGEVTIPVSSRSVKTRTFNVNQELLLDMPGVWSLTTGSEDVVVAVIEPGGFLYSHEDLVDNIWINEGERGFDANGIDRSINGIDDDLNGYIDDLHGYDFAFRDPDPDNIIYDGKDIYRLQPYWHGTSVAGIIGAKGDNGKGISGIAWNVSLMLLKAPSSVQFGFSSDTAKAYCYAEAIRYAVDNGARIINWSGTLNDNSEYATKTIGEAFIYAEENNVLIVVAAGSQAVDLDLPLNYAVPASINMSNLVKVTELDFQGDLYKYRTAYGDTLGSSFGLKSVTLGAIGENYTTWDYHSRSCYALGAGTSCSGPVVAGCAALMLSVNPELTPSEIRRILIETATPIESLGGITESGGAVNIYGAVKMAIDYKTSAESIHNN